MPEHKSTETIVVEGREYAIVGKAQAILSEMAAEMGIPRSYSRFAVYRLAVDNDVDIIATPSANYYSVEGLQGLKDKIRPERGNKSGRSHYTHDQRSQALRLHQEGLSNREIARRMQISYQSINNWVNKLREDQKTRN